MTLLSTKVYADRVLAELNGLRAEGKVQKFNLPIKGKSTVVVWRATTEILLPSERVDGNGIDADADDEDDDVISSRDVSDRERP